MIPEEPLPVEAVVFDLNGVLIDSMAVHRDLIGDLLDEAGVNLTEEEVAEYMGRGAEDFFRVVAEETSADFDADALAERKRRTFPDHVDTIPLMDGAAVVVQSLAEQYAIAVASNDQRRSVDTVLQRLDVDDVIDVVVTIEDVETGKPDPEVYRTAVERLAVDPGKAVAVDDTPVGVEAARRAGLRAVGFRRSEDVCLRGATTTVDSMAELEDAITGLDEKG